MFSKGATSYYVLRFLLGAGESGFFPGVILYLTFCFQMPTDSPIAGNHMLLRPLDNKLRYLDGRGLFT